MRPVAAIWWALRVVLQVFNVAAIVLLTAFIAWSIWTFPAWSESRIDYSSSSFIEIHEPDEDHRGARAAVTHHNEMVHGPGDNGTFSLSLPDGFTVDIIYQWNANGQSERFTVIPPPGYIAQPPEMDVCEGCTETVYVYGATS